MYKRIFIMISLLCTAAQMSAQSIHDLYSTKAEACSGADGYNYRETDGYIRYGQIGWEKEVGWRDIQYLDQYERDHRKYNLNSFLYCQVMEGYEILDDCEIVAVNSEGLIVGNQCPEPFPLKSENAENTAIMAIYGNQMGEEISFKVVTGAGTASDPLKERWAVETHQFVPNGTTGLVDSDGDGRLDTWQPVVLHLAAPTAVENVTTAGDGNASATLYSIDGRRLDAPQRGVNIIRQGGKTRKVVINK